MTLKKSIKNATKALSSLYKVSIVDIIEFVEFCNSIRPKMGISAPSTILKMGSNNPGYRHPNEIIIRIRAMIFLVDIEFKL